MKTTSFKHLAVVGIIFSCGTAFAQNTNTLLPFGNVGIGTLLPSAKLEVKGSTLLQSLSVTAGAVFKDNIQLERNLTVNGTSILNGTNIAGTLRLRGAAVVENVTNEFEVLLKDPITGVVSGTTLNRLNGALAKSGCSIDILNNGDGEKAGEKAETLPLWQSRPAVLFAECPLNLRVGIGTKYPEAMLHTTGNAKFNSAIVGSIPVAEALGTLHIRSVSNLNKASVFLVEGATLAGTATRLLQINNSGTLALGNVDPNVSKGLLHMKNNAGKTEDAVVLLIENNGGKIVEINNNGLIKARKIKLDAEAWPDYVFDPNYKLLNLKDLNTYIQTNRHLPNIPSASVVEKEGMDVAEMSKLLLEKVEELTKYIIQQQTEINTLKAEIKTIQHN